MIDASRRWDTDVRGHGVADGQWIAPGVQNLLDALNEPDWIAEDPDLHLGPRLRAACEETNSPWNLKRTATHDGIYVITLEWSRPDPHLHLLRADAFALIGTIAECSTFMKQHFTAEGIEYHATTGMLDGDSPFKGHGHVLQLRVGGAVVKRLIPSVH